MFKQGLANDKQRQHAIGYQTGQVVYATGGEALGTVSVYDLLLGRICNLPTLSISICNVQ